jgi:hypothetical protein
MPARVIFVALTESKFEEPANEPEPPLIAPSVTYQIRHYTELIVRRRLWSVLNLPLLQS